MRVIGLLLLAALVFSSRGRAQSNPFHVQLEAAAALRPVSLNPARLPLNVNLVAVRRFNSRAPGATLMIIGGAAIVAGALVSGSGGTLLILGGVGVGVYGFYLYTR